MLLKMALLHHFSWLSSMHVCVCVYSVQFSSVAQSCPTLYNLMNCSTPGLLIRHQFWVHPNPCPSSQLCHPIISSFVVPFSSCPRSFPASGSFLMSHLFASGGQSIGVSVLASFLPKNTQGLGNGNLNNSVPVTEGNKINILHPEWGCRAQC